MRGRGHYQQIPPTINDSSTADGSRKSLAFSKLFGAIHTIVGMVLPVAVALHTIHSGTVGFQGEFSYQSTSAYYIYLLLASILVLIIMKATGMMANVTGEQGSPQIAASFIKGGAVLFAICGILLGGFKFVSVIDGSCISCQTIDAIEELLSVIFILMLLAFVYKYSDHCITKNEQFARIAIMLLLATCMSCWSRDYVSKVISVVITNDFDYSICTFPNESNISESASSVQYARHGQVFHSNESRFGAINQESSDVLVPTTLAYYFIMSAFMFIMYGNIGGHRSNESPAPPSRHLTVRGSCIGLGFGVLVLVLSIAYVVAYTFALARQNEEAAVNRDAPMIYYGFIISLYPFTIICNLISHLKMRRDRNWFEDDTRGGDLRLTLSLLFISACGVFVTAMFNIIASAMSINSAHQPSFLLTHEILKTLDVFVQVLFLHDAFYRQPPAIFAPGITREITMFLIFTNFTFFWTNIYGLRDFDINPVQYCFYGFEMWTAIMHLAAPLSIYYRFHCFVMYLEIWMHE